MFRILLIAALVALAACSGEDHRSGDASAESAGHGSADTGISWFDGSVEAAFVVADNQQKPLFLYWGAVWCPLCQEIKSTVFKSQDFINLSRLFVPVYLDGDTERAQAWGEKFGVMGYPTMIVLNPAGEEVTRIPGGIDIGRYNSVLELSLNQMRPTSRLIQLVLDSPAQLSPDDYYQLAYYSWGQDTAAIPEGTDKAMLFRTLAEHAPAGEIASRFYLDYLVTMARKIKKDKAAATELNAADVVTRLTSILGNAELAIACWDTLAYYPDELLGLPVFSQEQRAELEEAWVSGTFDRRMDARLSKAEKMAGWLPTLYTGTLENQVIADELKEQLRSELTVIDRETPDSYERQSVMSQMSYIYEQAGMKREAKDLLVAELEISASPYYFMSGLASMAEKDGEFAEAIDWRRKAWESSTGQATRFQWGASYVRALIRLAPDDAVAITSSSIALLNEFEASPELFAGRNFRVLKRVATQLTEWQDEQQADDLTFMSRVEAMCSEQEGGSREAENCQTLLAPEGVAQAT